MPIISSRIIQDDLQADLRRWVRNEHTFSEGIVRTPSPRLVANDFDADAALLIEVPQLEASEKSSEKTRLEALIINKHDYVETRDSAIFNTLDEMEEFFVKRVSNRLRELTNERIGLDVPVIILFKSPLFDSSAPRLASLLGVSNQLANSLKSQVQALTISVEGYSHAIPIYEDVLD